MPSIGHNEGLKAARLLLVLSSLSPLFVLWAIRGSDRISNGWLILICAVAVVIPNLFLWLRIRTAQRLNELRTIEVGKAEDHREHLLVYLFAMLLPLYAASLTTWREIGAA